MALRFDHTTVPNFSRIFENRPRNLTKHPYLNFLRHYRVLNPKYDFIQLLQDGARTWQYLKPEEKSLYTQKEILKNLPRRLSDINCGLPFPARDPLHHKRISLQAERNVKHSLRLRKALPTTQNSPLRRLKR